MYIVDANSPFVAATLSGITGSLILNSVAEMEVTNALELAVFRKYVSRSQADQAHAAFKNDVAREWLKVIELDQTTFIETKELILQHTASIGCRTSDILHVASALVTGANAMFTFDSRQKELARRVKLRTN